jgi:hypothetical protein
MRMPPSVIAAAILSALCVAGCGSGPGQTSDDVPLAPTKTSSFDGMKDQMTKGLKGGNVPAPAPKK